MGLKFSIYSVLVLTGLVAVLVALNPSFPLVILAFVLLAVIIGCVIGLSAVLLRKTLNGMIIPILYKANSLWVVRYIFGRGTAVEAFSTFGCKLFDAQKFQEAADVFGRVLEFDSQPSNHWANRGGARYFAGDFAGAVTDLSEALKIDCDNELARVHRGLSFLASQCYSDALKDFQMLKMNSAQYWALAFHRGQLYEFHQQWQNALDDYMLAYNLDSSQLEAGIALARLQSGCPDATFRDGRKAVENATSMCFRTNWEDWIAISVLAAAYSETGDFDKALIYAQKSHDLAPASEKTDRLLRIEQYRKREPFRVPLGSVDCTTAPKDS